MLNNVQTDRTYRNIKTGSLCIVIGFAINTTNDQDGQKMVYYRLKTSNDTMSFVRELGQFRDKFEEVET